MSVTRSSKVTTKPSSLAEFAKSKDQSYEIQTAMQVEISKFLKSDEFKTLLKESIRGVISDMVQCAVKPFQDKIVELEAKVEKLQEKTNDNEQYSRRYSIRIYGLSQASGLVQEGVDGVVPKENCAQTVIDFCKDELGVIVKREEIDRAHRIGRPNDAGQRAIIVKFVGYESKLKVMRVKRRLRRKRIFINEDLTWLNQKLLKQVREACKGSALVYTADGYVMVRSKNGEPPVRVRKVEDLDIFGFD